SDNGQLASVWKSDKESTFKALSQNGYNFNAEYQLDSLNSINIGTNGFSSLKSTAGFSTQTNIFDGEGRLDSLYSTKNRRDYPQKNNTINAAYEHKFSKTANILISSDYTSHYFNQNQDVVSLFSLPGDAPYRRDRFANDDTRRIKLFSAQADFVDRREKSGIEAGVRFGKVDADNRLDFWNENNGLLVVNTGLSNQFIYDETILAGYAGYDVELGKWTLKGGLRGEFTSIEGTSLTTQDVNSQDYFKIFPTLYTLYKPSENHHIGASYGKRIVRPQYDWLNPFRAYENPYAYTSGDPGLLPTIAHNFTLLYTLKTKYNFDLYYRREKNPSMQISYQDYATNTLVTQITNIRSNNSYGLDMNTNVTLLPWWDMGLQANANYFENTFQGVDGGLYTNDKWSYGVYADNRFTLNKKGGLVAQINYYYRSP
ncbi:MAG: TonB-dependent receptor, partial [Flavobacterium sp.]